MHKSSNMSIFLSKEKYYTESCICNFAVKKKNLPLQNKTVVTLKVLISVHFLVVSEALANDMKFALKRK